MKKSDVKIGMLVTCKEQPVEAYGSRSPKGHPACFFEPGDIGCVSAIDVPSIRREGTFVCVDFYKHGIIQNPHHWQESGESPWRVGLDATTIRKLSQKERESFPYHSLTVEVCEPFTENKALIEAEFPSQFADTCIDEGFPSRVVVRLLHPITLWQIYWLGMQKGSGKMRSWYTLENEMPRSSCCCAL